jgi:hypothetical protein
MAQDVVWFPCVWNQLVWLRACLFPVVVQVCSIHQPRGSIFNMFDDLVLLADGQLVYQGAAQGALKFFEEQG